MPVVIRPGRNGDEVFLCVSVFLCNVVTILAGGVPANDPSVPATLFSVLRTILWSVSLGTKPTERALVCIRALSFWIPDKKNCFNYLYMCYKSVEGERVMRIRRVSWKKS